MPAYDDRFFNPPAPLASVTLRNLGDGKRLPEVLMLLDSGADVTLIPQQAVTLLGATIEPDAGYEVMGFDGRKSVARVVNLDLTPPTSCFCTDIPHYRPVPGRGPCTPPPWPPGPVLPELRSPPAVPREDAFSPNTVYLSVHLWYS